MLGSTTPNSSVQTLASLLWVEVSAARYGRPDSTRVRSRFSLIARRMLAGLVRSVAILSKSRDLFRQTADGRTGGTAVSVETASSDGQNRTIAASSARIRTGPVSKWGSAPANGRRLLKNKSTG